MQTYSPELATFDKDQFLAMKVEAINGVPGQLTGYDCHKCMNRGYFGKGVGGRIVTYPCDCMNIRKTLAAMETSGLRNIIKDFTFDKFVVKSTWQQTIKEKAFSYSKNPIGWFFITGQSGAGKTHLCTAICRELLLQGKKVHFLQWRDFVPKLQACRFDGEARDGLLHPAKETEYLFIDDLFKTSMKSFTKPTQDEIKIAFEILNFRQNANLPTIVSSELTLKHLDDIDSALAGRLVHNAGENVINIEADKTKNYRYRNVLSL